MYPLPRNSTNRTGRVLIISMIMRLEMKQDVVIGKQTVALGKGTFELGGLKHFRA